MIFLHGTTLKNANRKFKIKHIHMEKLLNQGVPISFALLADQSNLADG
jgi:hypothetical protein